jgi:cytochrome b pre-mRNA-processing protein 3
MIFAQWRARRASRALIEQILGEIVAAARRPALYEALGAPDRFDGRFELLTLHAGLVLRRLAALGGLADSIAQDPSPISTTRCARWDFRTSPCRSA